MRGRLKKQLQYLKQKPNPNGNNYQCSWKINHELETHIIENKMTQIEFKNCDIKWNSGIFNSQ